MRLIKLCFLFVASLMLFSCGKKINIEDMFKSEFDAPFPKKSTKDLSALFGDSILVKSGSDTIVYSFSFDGHQNVIVMKYKSIVQVGDSVALRDSIIYCQDTIFKGVVCKYKGNYILSRMRNDSTYMIYMLKAKRNLIYGLNLLGSQVEMYDKCIEDSSFNVYKMLVRRDSTTYRMHPNKKILGRFFRMLLDSSFVEADTIITPINLKSISIQDKEDAESIDDEEGISFSIKAYPNPVSTILNIELTGVDVLKYNLFDMRGNIVLSGIVSDSKQLNLNSLPIGVYLFSYIDPNSKQTKRLKILKK